jgi:hypothetical protein
MSQNPQTPDDPLTDIFISYRRGDTKPEARQLEADLERYFPGRVFRDMHDIDDGADYRDVIKEKVGKCGALLVLIGRQWLTLTDKEGKRRLDDPNDLVVAEIAGALKRTNVRVIPVLLQGAEMPEEGRLPEPLRALPYRQARKLDDDHWEEDIARLAAQLEKVCGARQRPEAAGATAAAGSLSAAPPSRWGAKKPLIAAGAGALVFVVALIALIAWPRGSTEPKGQTFLPAGQPTPTATDSNNPTATPAPNPTDAAGKPLERSAVVDLARNEAEFFFPFDTSGDNWRWFLPETKVEDEEYRWEVEVKNRYSIRVFLSKQKRDVEAGQGDGDFEALLSLTESGVESKDSGGEWAGLDKKMVDKKYAFQIEPMVEPGGLRVVVTGEGVRRMFADRPGKVFFLTLIAAQKRPDLTIPVKYK